MAQHTTLRLFEIIGLSKDTNGCTCQLHPICGLAVDVQDLLYICKETMVVNGRTKPVGAVYRVVDGAKTCKVAFVPKFITISGILDLIDKKFVTVTEFYANSFNAYKVLKDTKMNGMAVCTVIDALEHN